MTALASDRNLLFGLLALQNGLINQGQLVAAFQAWTLDKARALADHLVGRGDLDADDRSVVDALVAHHLKKSGGVAELRELGTGRTACGDCGQALFGVAKVFLEVVCYQRIDNGPVVGIEVTATDQVVGEGAGFVERPGLEGGHELALIN